MAHAFRILFPFPLVGLRARGAVDGTVARYLAATLGLVIVLLAAWAVTLPLKLVVVTAHLLGVLSFSVFRGLRPIW